MFIGDTQITDYATIITDLLYSIIFIDPQYLIFT